MTKSEQREAARKFINKWTKKKGVEETGNQVELINLAGKKIAGCLGCKYCFSHDGVCVQKDDMAAILEVLDQTDLLVLPLPSTGLISPPR